MNETIITMTEAQYNIYTLQIAAYGVFIGFFITIAILAAISIFSRKED